MINLKIIKLASDTKNYGLTNKSTHFASSKNKICGDKITIELNASRLKIKTMRYETESCIYCQASASLLSKIISSISIKSLKNDIMQINNFLFKESLKLPRQYKPFKALMQKKHKSFISLTKFRTF